VGVSWRLLVLLSGSVLMMGPIGFVVQPRSLAAQGTAIPPKATTALPLYGYTLVKTYPHDPGAFTQGLQYVTEGSGTDAAGFFYEGTGLNGRSSIRKVKPETGDILQRRDLPAEHFGEGIVVWQSQIIQLTWQSGLAFVYDRASFSPKQTFRYRGEGWGLTHDGTNLIMSDGTDELRVLNPATFAERRRIKVTAAGEPVAQLNELEYVKGEIFANVWQTDLVARINPATGKVVGWIDLRGLLTPRERQTTDVLNGIAYDAAHDRLFVTGKLWPKIFEVTLRPQPRL